MITKIIVLTGKKAEHERAVVFNDGRRYWRFMSGTKGYELLAEYAACLNIPVEEHYEPLKEYWTSPLGYRYTVEV